MSIPKIDPYPPAPTPEDDEATFDEKAYEHAASLESRRVQMNEVATYVNTRAADANSRAVAAAASATASANSATRSDEWANKAPGSVVASGKYSARHYSDLSDKFANAPEDVEVEPGKYSALHWQEKAKKIADVHATTVATDPLPTVLATNVQEALRDLAYQSDQLRVAKNQLKYGDGPYPMLDLQFAGAKILDPRFTFSRASKDWDWDGNEYGIDEPVITDQGLWLWGSRANLCKYSSDISEWDKTNVSVDREGAPDERLSRVVITAETPSILSDRVECRIPFVVGGDASFSFLCAKGSTTSVRFAISTRLTAGRIATINLDTLDVTGEEHYGKLEVIPVGGGLYRVFCVVGNVPEGATYIQFFPGGLDEGDFAFFGDVQATLDGMLSPTIPTNGSQVTVTTSNLAVQDDNLNINSGGGIVVKYSALKEPNDLGFAFRLGSVGQASNYIGVDYLTAGGLRTNQGYYRSGGDFYINETIHSPIVVGDVRVCGFSWSRLKVIDAANGETRAKEFSHVPPVNGNLTVGQLGSKPNGSRIDSLSLLIKNLTIFDTSLTDEQLQELTR